MIEPKFCLAFNKRVYRILRELRPDQEKFDVIYTNKERTGIEAITDPLVETKGVVYCEIDLKAVGLLISAELDGAGLLMFAGKPQLKIMLDIMWEVFGDDDEENSKPQSGKD